MFKECLYTAEKTEFFLWSPDADVVLLRLYDSGEKGFLLGTYQMTKYKHISEHNSENAIKTFDNSIIDWLWHIAIEKDIKGKFYTFDVSYKSSFLGETAGITPLAVGVNGLRGAIIDMNDTNPEGWEKDNINISKANIDSSNNIHNVNIGNSIKNTPIIYEVHHRDFSMHQTSNIKHKGKFLQWTEDAATEYLKELGITHLHILPSFDFGSVDEKNSSYNWGYDPTNYNVPEGSYSTNATDPVCRIKEFKKMVQNLHNSGIKIVMDVVYNHTYYTEASMFQKTNPNYFYRFKPDGSFANASWCDNEIASEKEFVRKYIISSMIYWVKEYHVDGFRLDLMGILDIETINILRKELDKIDTSIILYGEGWYAEQPQLPRKQLAIKENIAQMPNVACFSDEFRDGIRGKTQWGGEHSAGFVLGNGFAEQIKLGLVGGIYHPQINYDLISQGFEPWALQPNQFIAYASCHDDLCLADTLKITAPNNSSPNNIVQYSKLAHTLVILSQGVPFLFAGEEILRSKKFIRNTYNSSDNINSINWSNKLIYNDLYLYFQKIIKIRKEYNIALGNAEKIRQNLVFINVPTDIQNTCIAYELQTSSHQLFICINAGKTAVDYSKFLPQKHLSQDSKIILSSNNIICDNSDNFTDDEISMSNYFITPTSCLIFAIKNNKLQ
ncbi:type I pullulanase [Bacteroidia bacterium]|nr:type I pullulanase [Bacteroidia bacterium]